MPHIFLNAFYNSKFNLCDVIESFLLLGKRENYGIHVSMQSGLCIEIYVYVAKK